LSEQAMTDRHALFKVDWHQKGKEPEYHIPALFGNLLPLILI
jgi:hypothetical protein